MGRIVGIDLGTTNSVVAVLEAGRPHVIANAEGGRTTPSVVGYTKDQELLVGQLARRQLVLSPRNTFSNLKRFVGRDWDELEDSSLACRHILARILSWLCVREEPADRRRLLTDTDKFCFNPARNLKASNSFFLRAPSE